MARHAITCRSLSSFYMCYRNKNCLLHIIYSLTNRSSFKNLLWYVWKCYVYVCLTIFYENHYKNTSQIARNIRWFASFCGRNKIGTNHSISSLARIQDTMQNTHSTVIGQLVRRISQCHSRIYMCVHKCICRLIAKDCDSTFEYLCWDVEMDTIVQAYTNTFQRIFTHPSIHLSIHPCVHRKEYEYMLRLCGHQHPFSVRYL